MMLQQNYRAWVEIDLNAIKHNVRSLKSLLAENTKLMVIVKADAYGHGAIAVSQAALEAGASDLGVATIVEGIQLRNADIQAPIMILGAANSPEEVQAIALANLEPTICTTEQALLFNQVLADHNQILPIHLKIDTGMSRLGTNWQKGVEFFKLTHSLPQLKIKSIYSHLATADDFDQTILRSQQQRFEQVITELKQLKMPLPDLHIANTAAILTDSNLHYNQVRTGLGVYGFYPAPHLQNGRIDLLPAMQVKARISQIKAIVAGTGVSYGHSFVAPTDMKIATVAIGYADGVIRGLSNRLFVTLHDKIVPQVGNITMDQILIDTTTVPEALVGDIVTILGNNKNNNADRWANILGTISWEILCGFKHRLPRLFAESNNAHG